MKQRQLPRDTEGRLGILAHVLSSILPQSPGPLSSGRLSELCTAPIENPLFFFKPLNHKYHFYFEGSLRSYKPRLRARHSLLLQDVACFLVLREGGRMAFPKVPTCLPRPWDRRVLQTVTRGTLETKPGQQAGSPLWNQPSFAQADVPGCIGSSFPLSCLCSLGCLGFAEES